MFTLAAYFSKKTKKKALDFEGMLKKKTLFKSEDPFFYLKKQNQRFGDRNFWSMRWSTVPKLFGVRNFNPVNILLEEFFIK